jgi:hypothetical protein
MTSRATIHGRAHDESVMKFPIGGPSRILLNFRLMGRGSSYSSESFSHDRKGHAILTPINVDHVIFQYTRGDGDARVRGIASQSWRKSMLKSSLAVGLLTAALLSPANAAVSGPGTAAATAGILDMATPAAWVCGPRRCVWRPRWRGFVPRFAIWGPPRLPGCFYEKRRRVWVEVCV